MADAPASEVRPFWRSPRSLLYVVALVFLAIVLWRSRFWDSGNAIEGVGAGYFVAIPAICLMYAAPLAIRGRVMLTALGQRVSPFALAPLAYFGNTVGFMTPAASGEALRPALLRRTFGLPIAQGVGVVVFERLFSFYLFGVSCLLALSWTGTAPDWAGPPVTLVLAAACLVPSGLILVSPALRRVLQTDRLARLIPQRLHSHIEEGGATLRQLWLNPAVLALFVSVSALIFFLMAIQFWLIPEALGQDISLQEAYVVLTVSTIAGFLSGLPLGLGATDAVMLSLLRAYGVDTTEAGQIVILNRVLINLPTGLFGLTAYLIALRQRPHETYTERPRPLATASTGGDR